MEEEIICEKKVYFFESHQYALKPWAELKKRYVDSDILLISFDHHTDIIEPFLRYSERNKEMQRDMVSKIDFRDNDTIQFAIENLKNDEHIKAAIDSKIIKSAYIVSHDGRETPESVQEKERLDKYQRGDSEYIMQMVSGDFGITPLAERNYPEADIHMTSFMPEGVYECGDEYDDVVLEDIFLKEKMSGFSRMSPKVISANGMIQGKYILDIDLDYFHTVKAIEPEDYAIFANLVINAEIITVAEEPICVEQVRTDDVVTSKLLKAKLLELIKGILDNQ